MAYYQRLSEVKCTCCNWRYADYNVKLSESRKISDKYCEECKRNHPKSSEYPGRQNVHTVIGLNHPRNPSPPYRRVANRNCKQCECCQLFFYNEAVVKVEYECKEREHYQTYCLHCAYKHRSCSYDYSISTMASLVKLDEKLKDEDIYTDPIRPYQ